MTKRIVVGLWDCKYCGKKGISGLEKTCPGCGNPQGEGIKFYPPNGTKTYLSNEETKEGHYGEGEDWQCGFCGSYNRFYDETCSRCGASREDASRKYFDKEKTSSTESTSHGESYYFSANKNDETSSNYSSYEKQDNSEVNSTRAESYSLNTGNNGYHHYADNDDTKTSKVNISEMIGNFFTNYGKYLLIALVAMIVIGGLIAIFSPKTYKATVNSNEWTRTVTIQDYRWVDDDQWYNAPSGARNIEHYSEIYCYDTVLDHYETVAVEKSREVFDHTEYDVSYVDNGDGTFSEYTTTHDVYRTEYYTDYEEEPVYIEVPRYEEHYYYEIQKWVYNRTEKTSKENDYYPVWPEYTLGDFERVSDKSEMYVLNIKTEKKTYNVTVPEEYLKKYQIGSNIEVTVVAGFVTKINGESF